MAGRAPGSQNPRSVPSITRILPGDPSKSLGILIWGIVSCHWCQWVFSFGNTDWLLLCAQWGTWLWGGLSAVRVWGLLASNWGLVLAETGHGLCAQQPGPCGVPTAVPMGPMFCHTLRCRDDREAPASRSSPLRP